MASYKHDKHPIETHLMPSQISNFPNLVYALQMKLQGTLPKSNSNTI